MADFKLKIIENLKSATYCSERSEDPGGLQGKAHCRGFAPRDGVYVACLHTNTLINSTREMLLAELSPRG
jgi:hypothetical protein